MEPITPLLEIIIFITSIFAPAGLSEFELTVDERVVQFEKTEEGKWTFNEGFGTFVYTLGQESVITEFKGKQEFNMNDYLTLPIKGAEKSLALKNGMTIDIRRGEKMIIYTIRRDGSKDHKFTVSWENTKQNHPEQDNPDNPPVKL